MNEKNNITKTAMLTVCGRPNVGKSSLTNALVGEKVAIVSNKPQTTRNRICAILNRGESQFVFLDTPGLHKARTRLGDYMVNVVKESVADVDAVMLLVEPIPNVGGPEAELIARIIPENRDIVRAAKEAKADFVTDLDSYNWNKINGIRSYLAKDSIDEKSLFTLLINALNEGDYATASGLQVEMYDKVEELKSLYDSYVKNMI